MSQNFVYNFDSQSNIANWIIVNDNVMGGLSTCEIRIDEKGNGVFEGSISTANNGGFSSIRLNLNKFDVSTNYNIELNKLDVNNIRAKGIHPT